MIFTFKITSTVLYSHLSSISRVIASKSAMPILECFMLDLQDGKLLITAADRDTRICTGVEVASQEGTGRIALKAKMLMDALKEMYEQPIEITVYDDLRVRFTYRNGQFDLVGAKPDEYPTDKKLTGTTQKLEVSSALLKNGLDHTLFAVSLDNMRPCMTGVFFDIATDSITFVASDGHMLMKYKNNSVQAEQATSFILPSKPGQLLKGILKGTEDDMVTVEFDGQHAIFTMDYAKMTCRLIEDNYPAYNNVIPTNNPYRVIVDRQDLLGALKRVQVFTSQENNLVRLDIADQNIKVTAQDLDFSIAGEETVPCEYSGDNVKIGFKSKLLIEELSACSSDMVEIQLADPTRPGIFVPINSEDESELTMLLMPLLLND